MKLFGPVFSLFCRFQHFSTFPLAVAACVSVCYMDDLDYLILNILYCNSQLDF